MKDYSLIFSGLGKLSQANEYLSQAQWTVLKTPECGNEIKSRLYRNLGLLQAAKENFSEALGHLSNDVSYGLLKYSWMRYYLLVNCKSVIQYKVIFAEVSSLVEFLGLENLQNLNTAQ